MENKEIIEIDKNVYHIFKLPFEDYASSEVPFKIIIDLCMKYHIKPESLVCIITERMTSIYATTNPNIGRDDFIDLVNIFSNPELSMEEFEEELCVQPDFVKTLDNGDVYFGLWDEKYLYHKDSEDLEDKIEEELDKLQEE